MMTDKEQHSEPLTYKPVTPSTWKYMERLFESRGCPAYCWCMVWRKMKDGGVRTKKADLKASLKNYVSSKVPVGLLFYQGDQPVGWCSVAPRESFQGLSGDESLEKVWSITCFFIKREFRKQGLMEEMTMTAEAYARKRGAKYVEAYPVDKDSPSYRFMGFKPVFKRMGYQFKYKAGQRRNVMVKKV